MLRNDQGQLLTVQTLAVRSNDGKTAQIGPGGEQYDQVGLTSIMSGLLGPQQ
jgi:hypothetical protein